MDTPHSASLYQQEDTPYEQTVHLLYINKVADVPQPEYFLEVSVLSVGKLFCCFSPHPDNLRHTIPVSDVSGIGVHQSVPYTSTDYYIYTLRRILI